MLHGLLGAWVIAVIITFPRTARRRYLSPSSARAAWVFGSSPKVESPPRSPAEAIQLENVVRRAYQRPFALYLLESPQQELPEATGLLDLANDRFDDRFARRIDRRAGLGVQLAGHPVDDRRDLRQQLPLVVRLLRHGLAHDQLQIVHRHLDVIGLDEAVGALHDPRLWIGEVVLRLRVRLRRLGGLSRGGGLLLRARLQHPFRFANPLQPTLATVQFRRQIVAAPTRPELRILRRVRRLRLGGQLRPLGPQLPVL